MENTINSNHNLKLQNKTLHLVGIPTYIATILIGLIAISHHWLWFFIICIAGDITFYFSYIKGKQFFTQKYNDLNANTYNISVIIVQITLWTGISLIWLA